MQSWNYSTKMYLIIELKTNLTNIIHNKLIQGRGLFRSIQLQNMPLFSFGIVKKCANIRNIQVIFTVHWTSASIMLRWTTMVEVKYFISLLSQQNSRRSIFHSRCGKHGTLRANFALNLSPGNFIFSWYIYLSKYKFAELYRELEDYALGTKFYLEKFQGFVSANLLCIEISPLEKLTKIPKISKVDIIWKLYFD